MIARYAGPPMTLGNMRAIGVRALAVSCPACHRTVSLNVDGYADDIPVPAFGPRMVCTGCGFIGADAGPDWMQYRAPGMTEGAHR